MRPEDLTVENMSLGNYLSAFAESRQFPSVAVVGGQLEQATYPSLVDGVPQIVEHILRDAQKSRPLVLADSGVTAGGAGVTLTFDASTLAIGTAAQPIFGFMARITTPEGIVAGRQVLTVTAVNEWAIAVTQVVTFKPKAPNGPGQGAECVIYGIFGEALMSQMHVSSAILRQDLTGAAGLLGVERNITIALSAASPNGVGLSAALLCRGATEVDRFRFQLISAREGILAGLEQRIRAGG